MYPPEDVYGRVLDPPDPRQAPSEAEQRAAARTQASQRVVEALRHQRVVDPPDARAQASQRSAEAPQRPASPAAARGQLGHRATQLAVDWRFLEEELGLSPESAVGPPHAQGSEPQHHGAREDRDLASAPLGQQPAPEREQPQGGEGTAAERAVGTPEARQPPPDVVARPDVLASAPPTPTSPRGLPVPAIRDPGVAAALAQLEGLVAEVPARGGAWLLAPTDVALDQAAEPAPVASWRLWLAHEAGERSFGIYTGASRLAADGRGGVWVLGPLERGDGEGSDGMEGDSDWALCHIDPGGGLAGSSGRCLYRFPADSKLMGDGQGGVWILCDATSQDEDQARGSDWSLWHADLSSEQRLYSYPYDSQLAGDGQGGVWILCETEDCEPQSGDWALWHVTREGERAFYRYPKDAKLAGDGCGGVWVLCETSTLSDPEQGEDDDWCLWHATEAGERSLFQYPASSQLVGDGHGGVWLLCETAGEGDGDWCLWHASQDGAESCLYRYPKDSKLAADGMGGIWILCETTDPDAGEDTSWCLWRATAEHERNLYAYPKDSRIAV